MASPDSVTTSMHTPYYNNNKPEESSSLSQDYNYYYKAQIEEAYTAIYGRKMPPVIRSQIRSLMAQGAMPDLIAAVIEYSAAAPRPSWAYARTVLERQLSMGTRTAEQFEASCMAFRRKAAVKAAAWRGKILPEQNYSQREYGPECGGMSAADIEEAKRLGPSPKRVIEQCYSQREYDPAKVDGPSPEEIAAARML